MRRYAVLAAVALLAVAGCTSGNKTSSTAAGGGTATTLDPQEAARAPGVTADTIKIGVTYVDLKAVTSITTNHGDYQATYQALIDDLNERGGINGRKLQAVYAPINPTVSQPAEAACLRLTQDEKVFA